MASINVSEEDFRVVAGAAMDAEDRGDDADAEALDKLARKINAALTRGNMTLRTLRAGSGSPGQTFSWQDVPSTLRKNQPRGEDDNGEATESDVRPRGGSG